MRLNTLNPLNRNWGPNHGLSMRLLSLPNNSGGRQWFDIANNNHGTLGTGSTWSSARRDNSFGCMSFDGTNPPVSIPSTALPTGAKTVAFWINFDTLSAIVLLGGSGSYYPYISTVQMIINDGTDQVTWSHGGFTSGIWYHVAITHVGGVAVAYKNGVSLGGGSAAGSVDVAVSKIGGFANNTFLFDGKLDDVCFWNRSLSASEVLAHYQDSLAGYVKSLNWRSATWAVAGGASPTLTPPARDMGISLEMGL